VYNLACVNVKLPLLREGHMNKGPQSPDKNAPHSQVGGGPTGYLQAIALELEKKAFNPHTLFVNGHAQTIAAYAWPRRFALRALRTDEERFFEIEPGVRLLAHCRWHEERNAHPTLLLAHGLEGSSTSVYMLGTAAKAFEAGFNVLRLNQRNCGGTEHLTPTLYHSGMSGDLRAVVHELNMRDKLDRIFLTGFSMSGNIALKLAGEYGETPPLELKGICAVSPSVDLSASAEAIERPANRLYMRNFMHNLRRRIRYKQKLYPELYDATDLHLVRTIRDFDERYTAAHGGFINADDYYARASALPLLGRIRIPTLIIHAQDDPFIPFEPLRHPSIKENSYLVMLDPQHGGHVGFVASETEGEDRFWAENRLVEFCRLLVQESERDDDGGGGGENIEEENEPILEESV
jgi:predicted alpha/beta-fold hydrolase